MDNPEQWKAHILLARRSIWLVFLGFIVVIGSRMGQKFD